MVHVFCRNKGGYYSKPPCYAPKALVPSSVAARYLILVPVLGDPSAVATNPWGIKISIRCFFARASPDCTGLRGLEDHSLRSGEGTVALAGMIYGPAALPPSKLMAPRSGEVKLLYRQDDDQMCDAKGSIYTKRSMLQPPRAPRFEK